MVALHVVVIVIANVSGHVSQVEYMMDAIRRTLGEYRARNVALLGVTLRLTSALLSWCTVCVSFEHCMHDDMVDSCMHTK